MKKANPNDGDKLENYIKEHEGETLANYRIIKKIRRKEPHRQEELHALAKQPIQRFFETPIHPVTQKLIGHELFSPTISLGGKK